MNQATFNGFASDFMRDQVNVLGLKGKDYSSPEDRLDNFKRGGIDAGVEPETVALIYLVKHIDAIKTAVRNIGNPNYNPSEDLYGRFLDAANYCILMGALFEERRMLSKRETEEEEFKRAVTGCEHIMGTRGSQC